MVQILLVVNHDFSIYFQTRHSSHIPAWTTSEFMFNTWKGAKKISQDDVVSMTVSLHRVKIRTTANKYVLRTYKLNQCEQFNDRGTYSEGDRDRCDRLQTAGNMALIFGTFALCSLFGTVSLIIVNKYYELGIDIEFFEILMTFIAWYVNDVHRYMSAHMCMHVCAFIRNTVLCVFGSCIARQFLVFLAQH